MIIKIDFIIKYIVLKLDTFIINLVLKILNINFFFNILLLKSKIY